MEDSALRLKETQENLEISKSVALKLAQEKEELSAVSRTLDSKLKQSLAVLQRFSAVVKKKAEMEKASSGTAKLRRYLEIQRNIWAVTQRATESNETATEISEERLHRGAFERSEPRLLVDPNHSYTDREVNEISRLFSQEVDESLRESVELSQRLNFRSRPDLAEVDLVLSALSSMHL